MFSNNVIVAPNSELGRELRKWEQSHTRFSIDEEGNSKPGNPYQFRAYPKMLYKARQTAGGQMRCMEPQPNPAFFFTPDEYNRAITHWETFNASCQLIVKSPEEEAQAIREGWRESAKAAQAHVEALEQDIAKAAAEANFAARGMSEKARAEFEQAQGQTDKHVVDVVGNKRGRKPKAVTGSGPVEG